MSLRFLSSRFSFSDVLLFRMGSWPAVKRVIYPVFYDWILYIMGIPIPSIHLVSFFA